MVGPLGGWTDTLADLCVQAVDPRLWIRDSGFLGIWILNGKLQVRLILILDLRTED